MTQEQYRKALAEQKIAQHDHVRVNIYKSDGTTGYIDGIINLKLNPCEMCLSTQYDMHGNIDKDFVCGIPLDKIESFEKLIEY
jgi:hypothetical protein